MSNIPDKCSRCGAPIDWEKGASSIKCSFCGKTNYLTNNYLNEFKNYLKLRDPKKIIRNPFSLILFLPVIFLFLILNSPIKKQEKIKAEYWPTNWDKLKQTKSKDGTFPSGYSKKYKEDHTVLFQKDIVEACKYRDSLEKDLKNYRLSLEKALYKFNIELGYTDQFDKPIWGFHLYNFIEGTFNSQYKNPNPISYLNDKEEAIKNYKRIKDKFVSVNKTYMDIYIDAYTNRFIKDNQPIEDLISSQNRKLNAASIEVLRQQDYKDWQLYTRWSLNGIGDLYIYYNDIYKKSKNKEISFEDWLIKKGILDKSHFEKNGSLKYKYKAFELRYEVPKLCKKLKISK